MEGDSVLMDVKTGPGEGVTSVSEIQSPVTGSYSAATALSLRQSHHKSSQRSGCQLDTVLTQRLDTWRRQTDRKVCHCLSHIGNSRHAGDSRPGFPGAVHSFGPTCRPILEVTN